MMKHLCSNPRGTILKRIKAKCKGSLGLYCQRDNACENKMIATMNFLATKEDRKISYKSIAIYDAANLNSDSIPSRRIE